jgi:hypothetical protein
VGDVLHGTKNLRRYVRTCSLLRYLKVLDTGRSNKGNRTDLLYTPNKEDKFVVALNRDGDFCVWGTNKHLVLAFMNNNGKMKGMSPSIFARWFVRTQDRVPDLKEWPLYARYIWGAGQLGARYNVETRLPFHSQQVGRTPLEEIPFQYSLHNPRNTDSATIRHAVEEAVISGRFRGDPEGASRGKGKKRGVSVLSSCPSGPDLSMLPTITREVETLLRNPRLVTAAKREDGIDFSPEMTFL